MQERIHARLPIHTIGGDSRLAVQKIEKAHACDLDRHVDRLEAAGHVVLVVKVRPSLGHQRIERRGGVEARWVGNLGNHGVARRVLEHQMVILIRFALELDQGAI